MKRKQLTAILLSAALSVSACLPVSGIAALAAEADTDAVTIQTDAEEPVPDTGIDLETSEMEDAGTYEEENLPAEEEIVPEEEGAFAEEEIVSEETAPEETAPEETAPEETAPEETAPEETAPEETAPEETAPEETAPEETVPEETAPEESVFPDEVNEITEPADGQEEAETDFSDEAEPAVIPAEEPAGESTDIQIPEAVEEDLQQADESGKIELPLSNGEEGQIITEEPVEEKTAEDPALVAVPQENDFDSAEEISAGDSFDVEVTDENPYYFFKFTPAEDGVYTIFSESDTDTLVELFDAGYEQIASDDDSAEGNNFRLKYAFEAGNTYYFRVRMYGTGAGSFRVSLAKCSLVVQKDIETDLYKEVDEPIELKVEASGETALTYTWYNSVTGEDLQSGPDNTYTYTDNSRACISCTVTDENGESEDVWFNVYINVLWSAYPDGDSTFYVNPGESQELRAEISVEEGYEDAYSFTYRWTDGSGNVLQEGGTSYTVPEVNGATTVIFEAMDQYDNSKSIQYYLYNPGWLDVWPEDTSSGNTTKRVYLNPGDDYSLFVCDPSGGENPIRYTWYDENDTVLKEESIENYYYLENIQRGCTIRCHAEDESGNCADLYFYIRIYSYLTAHPEGEEEDWNYTCIDILFKDAVDLHVIAQNSEGLPLTYKWEKQSYDLKNDCWPEEWTLIPNQEEDTLTVSNPTTEDRYRCEVRDESDNSTFVYFSFAAGTGICIDAYVDDKYYGDFHSPVVVDVDGRDTLVLRAEATSVDQDRIKYRWAKLEGDDEQQIPGATGDSYTVHGAENGESYVCIVDDGYGFDSRLYFYFRHNNFLRISVDDEGNISRLIDPRSADTFTLSPNVQAEDASQLSYTWTTWGDNGEEEAGKESSLTIDHQPKSGTYYQCTVADQYGNSVEATYEFRVDTKLYVYPEGHSAGTDSIYCLLDGNDRITLKATVESEEGTALSWQWYKNDESIEREDGSGTKENTEGTFTLEREIEDPQAGDRYCISVWDEYQNSRNVWFFLTDQLPELEVYPDGERDEEGRGIVPFSSSDSERSLLVRSDSLDISRFSYIWKDVEGNILEDQTHEEAVVNNLQDGAEYSCEVTDPYGQTATVRFVLRFERQEGDPTEEDFANARSISVGDSVETEVTEEDPVAWFRFVPESSGRYEFYSSLATEDYYDTVAELYDARGRCLTQDDDGAGNRQFTITYTLEQGETYYYGARQYSREHARFTVHLAAGASEWLSDYRYTVEEDRIVLTWYRGEEADVTVPGSASAHGKVFDRIVLSSSMWPETVKSLHFEKGVALPECGDYIFNNAGLESIDLSTVDMSGVAYATKMFGDGANLQEIRTPVNVQAEINLPAAFTDSEAGVYFTLPQNRTESITLTRAAASDWLADYSYAVQGDRIRLISYTGDQTEIVVPGSGTVAGKEYRSVEISPGAWNWETRTLAFEKGVVLPEDCESLFSGLYYLTSIDLSTLNWSNVNNMSGLFSSCESLTELDLSGMDTSNVTDMSDMFYGCSGLTTLDLKGFDTSKVTNVRDMFGQCNHLQSLKNMGLDLSNALDMSYMFYNCEELTELDLRGMRTRDVTEMSCMFNRCYKLEKLDLRGFATSSLEDVRSMFRDCTNLTEVNLSSFDAAGVALVSNMFSGTKIARINTPAGLTSKVTLPAVYEASNGALFGTLPRARAKSVLIIYARDLQPGESGDPVPATGVTVGQTSVAYSGSALKPAVTVKSGDTVLREGTDYTIAYINNVNIGTARVTVTGKGDFCGIVEKTFTISAAALAEGGVTLASSSVTYNGKEQKPAVTVKSGSSTLKAGTDYTVAYSSNTNAGTATVTVTGKGNYSGTVKKTFAIGQKNQSISARAAAAKVAVGKTTTVSVSGTQEKAKVTYTTSNKAVATVNSKGKVTAVKVGTVKITATAAATKNYKKASKTVTIKVLPAATKTLQAENLAKGIKLTWSRVAGANGYIIYRNNKKAATIKKGATVTWTDAKANTNGTKYVYKVVAKASTGTSTLSKSLTFYKVARPAISSVKNTAAKKAQVKWGKNAKASGYELQYSLKKNFASGVKTVKVTKAATVSRVIGGLKKGKTYYFRIRSYKKAGKKTYTSVYSPVKSVKIKK